jgi:pimeloyl-ACP methyl ester carboxylesterase
MKRLSLRLVGGLGALALAFVCVQGYRAYALAYEDFRRRPQPFVPPVPLDGLLPVTLRTKSGLSVGASFFPPHSGSDGTSGRLGIVVAPGAQETRAQMWRDVVALAGAGFGVLAIDWPGTGESDGEISLGQSEREAFTAAVDFLAARPDVQRIGAYGFSHGAAMVTLFSADDPRVTMVLAVGGWTDALEQVSYEFRNWGVIRQWPAMLRSYQLMGGTNVRPIDAAPKLRERRTLFIAGADDGVVPPSMSRELAEAAGGRWQLIRGAGHVDFRDAANPPWSAQLVAFFTSS